MILSASRLRPPLRISTAPRSTDDPMEGRYGTIIADPAWEYQNWNHDTNADHGAAAYKYDLAHVGDMALIPVERWAARDCVLAMWATWPKLDEAMALVTAWGFRYVTGAVWVKTTPSTGEIRRGIGFWTMSASEPILFCRRGGPRMKGGRERTPIGLLTGEPTRVFYAPVGEHSEKPECVQDWLDYRFDGPRLELFARRHRPGWDCFGRALGWNLTPKGIEPWVPPCA
jgi:N6-adenosine-specific RNA methylase IME4